MNGIEKISARILADAETEAAAIRAQAGEKAAQIRADYDRKIESLIRLMNSLSTFTPLINEGR